MPAMEVTISAAIHASGGFAIPNSLRTKLLKRVSMRWKSIDGHSECLVDTKDDNDKVFAIRSVFRVR